MAGKERDASAKLLITLITLPFVLLWFILKALFGQSATSVNFARQGSGGRFRRVTQDEVDLAIQPIVELIRQAEALAARSGTMTRDEAEALLGEILPLADRIDDACDAYERKNFSFSHRRNAEGYEGLVANARGAARSLRKSEFEPQVAGEKNGDGKRKHGRHP